MKPRIALYSHDAQGLGHVRRNLAIAGVLAGDGKRDVLVMAGAKEAGVFSTPPGVELLTLPGLGKSSEGVYRARSLALPLKTLIRLRAETLCAVLESFEPDVLIADKLPTGIEGELLPGLDLLKARGGCRLVLGLREVLDDPATVRREWRETGALNVMRSHYDAIWIYGDPLVYDPVREYGMDDGLAAKVRHTGYLGRPAGRPDGALSLGLPAGDLVACLVGGGQDGFELASAFVRAELPDATSGVVLTGPFMPTARRHELLAMAAGREDLAVLDFLDDPAPLLHRARSVVAMGGYNTMCELLHLGCRTLVVPRVLPRSEQLIRARRLAALGVIDTLAPHEATPAAMGDWLAAPALARTHPSELVDLGGLARLPRLLTEVLHPSIRAAEARLAV
ncbi:MAG: glycosyltransferase [Solirubrobacterales bacterium]|nr:glycosyltransferase [Solirubrobacterales bacterium]